MLSKKKAEKKTFGQTLRHLRHRSGKTCRVVADGIGIAESMLNYYETDTHMPGVYIALAIADFYKVDFEKLIRGDLS